jgi:hypothetical protein
LGHKGAAFIGGSSTVAFMSVKVQRLAMVLPIDTPRACERIRSIRQLLIAMLPVSQRDKNVI